MACLLSRYILQRAVQPSCWEPVHRPQPRWSGFCPQELPFLPSQRLLFLSLPYIAPSCAIPPQCSPAWKIPLSLWISRKNASSWCSSNCLISMGIQKGNIGCERGKSVQQVWWEEDDLCAGFRLKERKYFFLLCCKQWFPYIQTSITCWHFSISKGHCELLHICMHTQLQTAKPGYSEMKTPWNENNTTRVRKIFVFLFRVCFAWLSKNLLNVIQTLCSCKLQSEAQMNLFSKISAVFSFCHNASCEWGEGKKTCLISQRCYNLKPLHFTPGEADSHSEQAFVLTVRVWIYAFFF